MRKLTLSFLPLTFSILLHAQKDLKDAKWAISFSLAYVPLPGNGQLGVQPGVSYQPNKHLSLLTEIAFPIGKNNESDPSFMDKRYIRIKPEIRFLLSNTNEFKDYIGLQVSYTARSFASAYGFYYSDLPGDSVISYDHASINSPIITTSVQVGSLVVITKSIMLEGFFGVGIRSVNTEYTEVVNPHVSPRERSWWTVPSYYYPGNRILFHANFGIRILYFFRGS
jgi:hypothetical protein